MSSASSEMPVIGEEELKAVGEQAREWVENEYGRLMHNCWFVVDRMQTLLHDEYDLSEHGVDEKSYAKRHVLVDGEHKHYILLVDGGLLSGFHPDNTVWVDPSFDQFCDENFVPEEEKSGVPDSVSVTFGKKNELENVRVLRADDDRRHTDYEIPAGKKSLR